MRNKMSLHGLSARSLFFCCGALCFALVCFGKPQTSASASGASAVVAQQGVYVVFPFENAGASPRLDWLGEGLEELTIEYLSAAGLQAYSHAARTGELERNGLPFSAKLSRASMLRIAQDLDADFVIFGSFTSDGKSLTVEARVLRIEPPTLVAPVRETSPLDALMDLQTKIVWKLLSASDRTFTMTLADFSKAQDRLRLDAFEHYIRGVTATDDEVRLRELREAARLEPNWPDPSYALGETYFSRNDCNSAVPLFARIPKTNQRYAEAEFATGVCRLQQNQPLQAEEIFTSLQTLLGATGKGDPQTAAQIPEILNNLAIARERQGKTPAAQADLRRATDLDPDEDDYPFNLGLLAMRSNNFAMAVENFREASERKPDSPEDRAFLIQSLEKAGKKEEAEEERTAAADAFGPGALTSVRADAKKDEPMRPERIKRELDTAALRLQMELATSAAAGAAAQASADTTAAHVRRARQELAAGRLDAAEAEFRSALRTDPNNAAAHRGLAELHRRRGKLDDAVKELEASLTARDSAAARTILARVYLELKKPELARTEAQRALKLAPNYAEAKELLAHLQNVKSNGGAQ
jgi:tetratricopeptide (TPR) repeat protein/TolB-like protein